MPSAIKRLIHSSFRKLGYRLVTLEGRPGAEDTLSLFFAFLKQHGFSPRHVIDVGANRGNWTRVATRFFPDARYTLVEPQDFLKAHIKDLLDGGHKIRWIHAGAGDVSGEMPFSLAQRDDSSSFTMTEEQAKNAGLQRVLVKVQTLNEIVRGEGPAEMVKIDAEGLDMRVLAGASELFGRTDIFFVEVSIRDVNRENSLERVVRYMNEKGYHCVEITDLNRSPKYGLLWLCELAFLKHESPLLNSAATYE